MKRFGIYTKAVNLKRLYSNVYGIPFVPVSRNTFCENRAKRIAVEFEAMQHNPNDPQVIAAFDALANETINQYRILMYSGLVVDFYPKGINPYPKFSDLFVDVIERNHMYVYPTIDGYGSGQEIDSDSPMLRETEFKTACGKPMLVNDLFRVVHDYFGHIMMGNGFRAEGEEAAFVAHSSMFTKLARRALATETRGQNSWLNFGPHGEFNRTANQNETIYAEQKIGLLPEWCAFEGLEY